MCKKRWKTIWSVTLLQSERVKLWMNMSKRTHFLKNSQSWINTPWSLEFIHLSIVWIKHLLPSLSQFHLKHDCISMQLSGKSGYALNKSQNYSFTISNAAYFLHQRIFLSASERVERGRGRPCRATGRWMLNECNMLQLLYVDIICQVSLVLHWNHGAGAHRLYQPSTWASVLPHGEM